MVLSQQGKEGLLTNWWTEGKLEASEELGDALNTAGALALCYAVARARSTGVRAALASGLQECARRCRRASRWTARMHAALCGTCMRLLNASGEIVWLAPLPASSMLQ